MIIYFVRHASAGEGVANPKKDEKRPLDADGIQQCGYLGRALAALNVQPDVIVSSPFKRATQTASLIGNEIGYEGKLQLDPAMKPEASFAPDRKRVYSRCCVFRSGFRAPQLRLFAAAVRTSWSTARDPEDVFSLTSRSRLRPFLSRRLTASV